MKGVIRILLERQNIKCKVSFLEFFFIVTDIHTLYNWLEKCSLHWFRRLSRLLRAFLLLRLWLRWLFLDHHIIWLLIRLCFNLNIILHLLSALSDLFTVPLKHLLRRQSSLLLISLSHVLVPFMFVVLLVSQPVSISKN